MAVCRSDLIWPSASSAKAIVRSCSSSTLITDHAPNNGRPARFPAAINKIIAAKLMEEDERPVNGALAQLFADAQSFERSDSGANRSQQERRKMRVIGRF